MKIIIAIILCLIGAEASASGPIYCSHIEICKMLNHIALENKLSDLKTENLVNITGDPHEYEPSSGEIKNLINAPLLITGPNELNPWIKKVNFQRSKSPSLKTISLLFEKNYFDFYPKASGEALSHFWLYPKIYCSLKTKLEIEMIKLGYVLKSKDKCSANAAEETLKAALTKIKQPIILTHDALLPLLQNLDPTHTIVAIKGSGHHEETSALSIKKMYDALEAPVAVWVIETGINVPQNIQSKIRKNDIILKIDTANTKETSPFSVLTELTEKLKGISK